MISIKINNFEFLVKCNISILEACQHIGIYIPRFCYHEILAVAGNCRMCLVELENNEKPIASCVTEVTKGMVIWIDTPFVKKARENVIENLLANHPLDCPICDQGGECDLQDQTKIFGSLRSRFYFNKRGVENKYCGLFIKTIMNRCIHCTRCIRFGNELNGVEILTTLNRGVYTEIGNYFNKNMLSESEISGNVIDLCPVGALTSKPYSFETRPWKLKISETIDLCDSLGSNIFVMFKESQIYRILPKTNNSINGTLISDKIRFSHDSNNNNRITKIYIKKNSNILNLKYLFFSLDFSKKFPQTFFINDELNLETILFLKFLSNKFNLDIKNCNKTEAYKNIYISNLTNKIKDLDNSTNICFLLSSNPKLENSILNTKLRIKHKNNIFSIFSFGQIFFHENLINFVNLNIKNIFKLIKGKSKSYSSNFNLCNNNIVIGESLNNSFKNLKTLIFFFKSKFINIKLISINRFSNTESNNLLNIKTAGTKSIKKKNSILINLEDTLKLRKFLKKSFFDYSIWFNTHGSEFSTKFNYIIPTRTHFEEESTYINLEQRPQKTQKIFKNKFNIEQIQTSLSAIFKTPFYSYKNKFSLSYLFEILDNYKKFEFYDSNFSLKKSLVFIQINNIDQVSKYPLKSNLEDYYCSNQFLKNSNIMQNASQVKRMFYKNFLQ